MKSGLIILVNQTILFIVIFIFLYYSRSVLNLYTIIGCLLLLYVSISINLLYYQYVSDKMTNTEKMTDTLGSSDQHLYNIKQADDDYNNKFSITAPFTALLGNNKMQKPLKIKNKIIFITFENRNGEYIDIHNMNISQYVQRWNYVYKFFSKCNHNVYWCKIHLLLNELRNNECDYVIWLDSDTVIKKPLIDINTILNSYSSDIFIGGDNMKDRDLVNSGVFIIKNSDTGKQFLLDCINTVDKHCFMDDGKLRGIWAGSCYEQGMMNLLIADKYSKNTTVLPTNIIYNSSKCYDNTFIMHLYASSDVDRKMCFTR